MNNLHLKISRIDLPVHKPLVLGPGLEIHTIPYYCARITDGVYTGTGWGVSSPLWGGFSHVPLEEGIVQVERLLLETAKLLMKRYVASSNLARELVLAHADCMGPSVWEKSETPIPVLIRGMVLAPIEGALCDYLAQTQGMDMVTFLATQVASDANIFSSSALGSICPFLTIGGTSTLEDVAHTLQAFGQRPVVKFKIGSKKDPVAEAEFVSHVMSHGLPPETYMVIDNNQAYTPEECRVVVEKLQQNGVVDRLRFFEQPFKREQEPQDFDKLFFDIAPEVLISLDESVGSAGDLRKLAGKLSTAYAGNVLCVPKFEKGGLVEIVSILEEARRMHVGVTPSTLTGPPAQLPQYWDLFRHVAGAMTVPGYPTSFGAEANGYEILNWKEAVQLTIRTEQQSAAMFSATESLLAGSGQREGAWPVECALKDWSEIPWTNSFTIL